LEEETELRGESGLMLLKEPPREEIGGFELRVMLELDSSLELPLELWVP